MAKKKRSGKRRRVGAMSLTAGGKKSQTMKLVSIAAGVLAGDFLNVQVDKIIPKDANGVTSVSANMVVFSQVGLGGLLLMKSKNPIISLGGGFVAGAGLRRVLKHAGVIKGYQAVPVIGRHRMAGFQQVPVIGGGNTPPQLAGVPGQLQGYRVNGYTPHGSGMGVLAGFDTGGSGVTNTTGGGYMG